MNRPESPSLLPNGQANTAFRLHTGNNGVEATRGLSPRIARQSLNAVPTLVIGLGGTGLKVIRRLRKLRCRGGAGHIELLGADTDLREGSLAGKGWVDQSFIDLRVARLAAILNHPERHPSLSFVPSGFKEGRIWIGAGQKPINGALAFHLNQARVADRIRSSLTRLLGLRPPGQQENDTSVVRVVVVGSIAGGTGRGALIPLGQCLRDIVEEVQGTPDTHISVEAYLLLPSCFSGVLKPQNLVVAKANAYAQLLELSLLDEQPAAWPYRFPGSNREKRLTNPPFDRIVLLDRRTQSGEVATLEDLYSFLAEFLWLQLEQQNDESLLSDSLIVNVPDRSAYGKPARYQAVGGHVLKFDADRVVGYGVQRYLTEQVVGAELLDREIPADALRRQDLVATYGDLRAKLEEAVREDDLLVRDRRLREEQLGGEFVGLEPAADLAWVGAEVSAGLPALRTRFATHVKAAAQEVSEAARARVQAAFAAAAARVGGGLPAFRTQLERMVREVREELACYGAADIGSQEREHETALSRLSEGPAVAWLRGSRTRARFRRWRTAYHEFTTAIRDQEIHAACREVLGAALAAAEALLGRLAALEDYLRTVRTVAAKVETPADSSAIVTSAVPAREDPAIYERKLLPGSDPADDVRQSMGSFVALLAKDNPADRAAMLEETARRVDQRFRARLATQDVFQLCADHGGLDIGRWIAEALHVQPLISIDRASLGERDEGSITIISVPNTERAAACGELEGGDVCVHKSDNPHRVVVMKAYTSLPLFALADIDDMQACYQRILLESERNPGRFPHIHKDIPQLGYSFLPRDQEIGADLLPVGSIQLDHRAGA